VPEPHDFTVRSNIVRLRAVRSLTGPAQSRTRPAINLLAKRCRVHRTPSRQSARIPSLDEGRQDQALAIVVINGTDNCSTLACLSSAAVVTLARSTW
jgi:hypothetical protein